MLADMDMGDFDMSSIGDMGFDMGGF